MKKRIFALLLILCLLLSIGVSAVNGASGFTDVDPNGFYAKAVTWAAQNNITQGMTKTTFGVGDPCTRGHVVTFLYRYFK